LTEFSDEQRSIIDLSTSARTLVNAAAGTGKTHTLVGRMTKLVERDDLSSGDDLLVLSFSRAAVAELRRRAGLVGGDTRYVGAATFDSFATRLLAATDAGNPTFEGGDYDSRIRAAVKSLRQGVRWDELALIRHILIDEIQDLVGARAELVIALLSSIDCGFTLFGDPAQAIYGHRARGTQERTNADLYAWIRGHFRESLRIAGLTVNHRAETSQTEAIAVIGEQLRADSPDHSAVADQIRTAVLELPVTTPTTARRLLTKPDGMTSAVLTRTNGEALALSRQLFEAAVPHRLQRRGEDKAVAGWVSEAVVGLDARTTAQAVAERLQRLATRAETTAEILQRLLRLLDPRRGDEIDLRRVADRIRRGDVPEELNEVVPASVVVSTIHRAKGLEFDRVLMCDPWQAGDDADPGEENRIAYVGMSRARREIWHLEGPATKNLTVDRFTRRWVRRGFGADRWKVYEIEVVGTDANAMTPAGAWLVRADVLDTQSYIRADVNPGDSVDLVLCDGPADGPTAHYSILHRGRAIGVTSDSFGEALHRVLGTTAERRWPMRIDQLHVELVDTVAGLESAGKRYGTGAHGIWARVRVCGLGVLSFEKSRET
jgi:AAA domain/UvrD-like helicase C-terminal domain